MNTVHDFLLDSFKAFVLAIYCPGLNAIKKHEEEIKGKRFNHNKILVIKRRYIKIEEINRS